MNETIYWLVEIVDKTSCKRLIKIEMIKEAVIQKLLILARKFLINHFK